MTDKQNSPAHKQQEYKKMQQGSINPTNQNMIDYFRGNT